MRISLANEVKRRDGKRGNALSVDHEFNRYLPTVNTAEAFGR